jgi:bacterioferritin
VKVSIQYMFQHSIVSSQKSSVSGKTTAARQLKFVTSHSPVWFPGSSLRKIAIAEMRHAEAIVESVVLLGGEPTTQPEPITIGKTVEEMLNNDRDQEAAAIQLYRAIIRLAENERDDVTTNLFQRILSDEEAHHRVFSDLLGAD